VAPEAWPIPCGHDALQNPDLQKGLSGGFQIDPGVGDAHKDEPMMQNDLAWMIVSDKSIEHPDLDLAQTMAQRATDGAKEPAEKSMFMDTLARVKFMQGSKEEAIALEQKALALAGDDSRTNFKKRSTATRRANCPRRSEERPMPEQFPKKPIVAKRAI
jgi:hypothetical protein